MEKLRNVWDLMAEEDERQRAQRAREDASGLTAARDAEIRAKMAAENIRYAKEMAEVEGDEDGMEEEDEDEDGDDEE